MELFSRFGNLSYSIEVRMSEMSVVTDLRMAPGKRIETELLIST